MPLPALLRRCLREPLVHFAVLGAALFAIHARTAAPPRDGRIVVSADFVAGLSQEHRARTGRAPTPEEERALVDRFVEEEVLYREAVALGLDRGDPIVRRRLAQKMIFVAEDGAAAREPTDADLEAYRSSHADRYREAPRTSFRHVFVSRDRRGDSTDNNALRLLADLKAGAVTESAGDPFLQGAVFTQRTQVEVEAVFGRAFAEALVTAPVGAWAGPMASSYGVHLVKVTDRMAGAVPPLPSIRSRVRADLLDERKQAAVRALRERLRARYQVEIEAPRTRIASAPEGTR
ncbi:MAG: peptidylprolyl isomerase [Minicystis sp.]